MSKIKTLAAFQGWTITHCTARPVAGRWQAERSGVTLSAHSWEALRQTILARSQH